MIKLSLTPDLRFANDKLVNRKATIMLGSENVDSSGDQAAFEGTFSVMPANVGTQVAITAQATVPAAGWTIDQATLADETKNKVELKANIIKNVFFKKNVMEVDTGLNLSEDDIKDGAVKFEVVGDVYTLGFKSHGDHKTLTIKRSGNTEAETAAVEFKQLTVATGTLVGNTMGFVIKGGDPVRIHALCNWVGHEGLKENRESFKMVTKDHDALVLTLATNPAAPKKPGQDAT